MMREKIEQAIREIVGPDVKFAVERPAAMERGDYSTNVALIMRRDAQEIADKILVPGVKVKVEGKFINFRLSKEALIPIDHKILQQYKGQKIMVEYTDPNPFKEFHIGHLMSNAIGESIARLLEITGAQVIRANYQGDVGPHVAKAIWGKMQNPELSWGQAYTYGSEEYEKHKEEIDLINKKVYEKSDLEINKLYDHGRKESLEHFNRLYEILGTKFDFFFFESETSSKGLALIKNHPEYFEQSQGAVVYRGVHTRVFLTSQGLPTYEAKDLGLLQLKKEKVNPNLSITVTANEQNDYFQVVLEVAKKISEISDIAQKTRHISHGLMKFQTGKMSSRLGNVITGESLIEDMAEKSKQKQTVTRERLKSLQREVRDAKETNKTLKFRIFADFFNKARKKLYTKTGNEHISKNDRITTGVGIGAIKYTILRQSSHKDIIFDPDKSLSLEGDSGPYLQYALVRARSVLRKAEGVPVMPAIPETDYWMKIARVLIHYPDVVSHAAKDLEPHYVSTYLLELATAFNSFYGVEHFIVNGQILGIYKQIVQAVADTMESGLNLLGIPAPEEM